MGRGVQGQTPLDLLVLPQVSPALGRALQALGEEAPKALPLPMVPGGASRAESHWVAAGERGCPHQAQSPRRRVQRPRCASGYTVGVFVAVPVVKPAVLPGTKALSAVSAQAAAAQKNKLKEPGGSSFR